MRESLFKDRIDKLLNFLERYRYSEVIPLKLSWGECVIDSEITNSFSDKEVIYKELKEGNIYSGYDKYWWIKVENFIVPDWKSKKIIARIFYQKQTDEWDKGTEGLVLLDDKPWQGIDQNHLEIYLPNSICNRELNLKVRYWTGANNHDIKYHKFYFANIGVLNETCDKLYFMVKNIQKTIELAEKNEGEAINLIKALDKLHKFLSLSEYSDKKIKEGIELLEKIIGNKKDKETLPKVKIIGHTHIDVAWQWRFKHTHEKALRSFSTVMRLMENYPEYKFLQSTPQLYEYIRNDCSQLFEKIKERIAEKRWECEGGMWVEADCNIPSGESLVRQFLYGKRYFRENFNYESKILWLPDVFGYNWALPQIMKKSGIDYFMTTKISWNQYNRMPNETFLWKGMDGSEVLTHFINTPEEGLDEENIFRTYNGMVTAFTVKKMWEDYTNKELNDTLLNCYGYGDGGGGVNREMLENAKILNELPTLPKVQQSFALDYFEELERKVIENKDYLNTLDGELYFELHRGTYTSQAFIKKENRRLEYKFRNFEILSVDRAIQEKNFKWFNEKEYDEKYKKMLTNQFHDIIPGTSIKEVYDDVKVICCELNNYLDEKIEGLVTTNLVTDRYTLINLNGNQFDGLVNIESREEGYFTYNGKKMLASKTENGYKVAVIIPALESIIIEFIPQKNEIIEDGVFIFDGEDLITPFYNVKFKDGIISELYDKINRRQISAGNLNQFTLSEDIPVFWDSWDIEIHHKYKMELLKPTNFKLKSCDELQIVFEVEYNYSGLEVKQNIIFYSNSLLIDFETEVNYKLRQKLLKTFFDVDIRAVEATYDIQFGNIKRPTTVNNDWQMAQFECVAHRYMDLSDNGYGVAILNDCKYGHIIKNNRMELTLIKGGIFPDKEADMGKHTFKYCIYPHKDNFVSSDVIEASENYNNIPIVTKGERKFKLPIELKNKNISISCLKKAIDNEEIILRLYENRGIKTNVDLSQVFPNKKLILCNLIEDNIKELSKKEREIFTFNPYEIHTFKII